MALTPDQTAVLELLLGGQTYSELEDLLGMDEAEIRVRARAALTELGGADPDRHVGLSDYLLGQADPIGRADAVRHLRQDADDHVLATTIAERLAELAPAAELPKLPPAPGGGSFLSRGATPAPTRGTPERRSPLSAIPQERGRLYAALGAAAVILIAIVLAATGAFSGDDEPEAGGTTTSATETEIPGEDASRVPLTAVGQGDARGAAIVAQTEDDQPYMDLIIANLEPAPQAQSYVVWFMFDKNRGYPISPFSPNANGEYNDRLPIPAEAADILPSAVSIEVSISNGRQILTEIQRALQQQTFEIERPGRTVLRGVIPRAEPASGG